MVPRSIATAPRPFGITVVGRRAARLLTVASPLVATSRCGMDPAETGQERGQGTGRAGMARAGMGRGGMGLGTGREERGRCEMAR